MADITNKNELKRRIELFLDELDYSINEDFCKETMKMMREFIGHASHRLDCEESRVKSLKKKLKEYRDLEKQGLLLRLPCKVGDTVWVVTSPFNVFEGIEYNEKNLCNECYESFISSVTFYKNSVQYRISAKVTNHFIGAYFNEQNFGKTVFLTKAEAEQKLKAGGENDKSI